MVVEEVWDAVGAGVAAEGVPACWGVEDVSSSESSSQPIVSVGALAAPAHGQFPTDQRLLHSPRMSFRQAQ